MEKLIERVRKYKALMLLEFICEVNIAISDNIDIIKNDIADTPYTGITVGWGWGTAREKFGNIRISKNRIHNVMQTLTDGGHIYTLGNMPGSVISENYMTYSCKLRYCQYVEIQITFVSAI